MNNDDSYQQNELDSRLERFDRCWHRGDVPAIEDFFPPEDFPDDAGRLQLLIELVLIDLEYRWQRCLADGSGIATRDSTHQAAAGCQLPLRPLIEDYVRRYPELGPLDQLPLDLITDEYRARWLWGDKPHIDEYSQRFPQQAEPLRVELSRIKRQLDPRASSSGTHIRCPHCYGTVVLADSDLSDLQCPSCGSHFSLVGQEDKTDASMEETRLGHIELLEQIGSGGFGTVWRARDHELDRVIAVKIPRRGQLATSEVEQFLREARAAAQLHHPNIVPVHHVGRENDTVYIASEYVEGQTLAELIDDRRLTIRESVELCIKVAEALHHAHEGGVVHRDLKPSNIMVDSDNEPHIMDFGLARREAGEVTVTVEGKVLGTPAYMSPEQAKGQAHHADRRSDVYSLGVILFELLTGERPFRGNVRMLLHHVIHDDPPAPRKLNSSIHRDLETICLRCLEKDPRKRYRTGRELAEELQRFLRGEPIRARAITRLGRTWRWCQRYPMAATVVAVVVLIAIVAPLVAMNQARLAVNEAAAREEYRRQLYVADMVVAHQAWDAANVGRVRQLLARHVPGPHQIDLRGFQWYHLWQLCRRGWTVPSLSEHQASIWSLAFSPDGRTLASASINGEVMIWDVPSGKRRGALQRQLGAVLSVAFAPDGQTLAAASAQANKGSVEIWDAQRLKLTRQLDLEDSIACVAISRDGQSVAWGNGDGTVSLCDYHDLKPEGVRTFEGQHALWVTSLAFSPEGKTLISGSADNTINLWDVEKRELRKRLRGHESWVRGLAVSANGALIASASHDKTVKLWDLRTGELKKTLNGHRAHLWSVAFSPDSNTLASASSDGTVRLWDVVLGAEKDRLIGHENPTVLAVAYSPDGSLVASAGADARIKLWDATGAGLPNTLTGHQQAVMSVAVSPDNKTLASASADTTINLWDVPTGSLLSTLRGHTNWVNCVCFSHNGELLASAGQDGMLKLWDANSGEELKPRMPSHGAYSIWSVAFSPDDNTLATGDHKGIVTFWDIETRRERARLEGHHLIVWPVVFSPNGETLASGGWVDKTIRLWDVTAGRPRATLEGHSGSVFCVAFSADGSLLASGSDDTSIKLWDVATGEVLETLTGHAGEVMSVGFSPDGKTLVSGSSDATIKLWYLGQDREPETLTGHQSVVNSVTFSHDGLALVSGSSDNTVRIWQRASPQEVRSTRWLPSLGAATEGL